MIAEVKDAWDKLVADWRRRHRLAEEAKTEGRVTLAAVNGDTVEGDIQAARTRNAWSNQIKLIEQKQADGTATQSDELLLRQLRLNVRLLDEMEAARHPTPENMAGRRLADFGPVGGARGFLGGLATGAPWLAVLGSPFTWVAVGLAAFGVQSARITHLHHDLDSARAVARGNAQAAQTWQERAHAYEQATADAAAAARITRATLEAERRRTAAAAARERRRQSEIANVNAGASPPDWDSSLRDNSVAPDQPGAATAPANSDSGGVLPRTG